jgi:hypothetical protein
VDSLLNILETINFQRIQLLFDPAAFVKKHLGALAQDFIGGSAVFAPMSFE